MGCDQPTMLAAKNGRIEPKFAAAPITRRDSYANTSTWYPFG
jgi:hypothetical protein